MLSTIKNKLRNILPQSAINKWHLFEGWTAFYLNGQPTHGMKVIGVTGTNGKTTTAHLVTAVFESAGFKVAMATTIDFKIGKKTFKNNEKQTTLNPFKLQRFLKRARNEGVNVAVIEVTSHSLVQNRLWGIKFNTCIFTNLTHDHLDYHKTMENYRKAKELLFSKNPDASFVINGDDKSAKYFLHHQAKKRYVYSLKQIPDELYDDPKVLSIEPLVARKIIASPRETMFTAVTPNGQIIINSLLHGRFNISNTLAAIGAGLANNIPPGNIKQGVESVTGVKGRMERIDVGQPFLTMIDYAHTPDAFEKVYEAVMPLAKRKIIAVHGATGARDTAKRPILGSISGKFADIVIVTNEDPYHEKPMDIIHQVAAGVPKGAPPAKPKKMDETLFLIEDRREAIAKALKLAQKGDVVLVLGKGAEEVMAIGDPKANHGFRLVPWNEKEIVKEELNKLGFKKTAAR